MLRPQAPPARMDTEEQRRPTAFGIPCNWDRVSRWRQATTSHLRGGPAATAAWLSPWCLTPRWLSDGLLARDGMGGGGGIASLIISPSIPALAFDVSLAWRTSMGCSSHHQGLAHGTGGVEVHRRATRFQTTEARRTKRGTLQGGVISPQLANLYFRRFLLACTTMATGTNLMPTSSIMRMTS